MRTLLLLLAAFGVILYLWVAAAIRILSETVALTELVAKACIDSEGELIDAAPVQSSAGGQIALRRRLMPSDGQQVVPQAASPIGR